MSMFSVGRRELGRVGAVAARAPVGASYLDPSRATCDEAQGQDRRGEHEERRDDREPVPAGERGVVEREPGPATHLRDEVSGRLKGPSTVAA